MVIFGETTGNNDKDFGCMEVEFSITLKVHKAGPQKTLTIAKCNSMLRKRKYTIQPQLFSSQKSNPMVFILGYKKKMRFEKYAFILKNIFHLTLWSNFFSRNSQGC